MQKLAIVLILVIAYLVTKEVLVPGLFFPIHDTTHVARAYFLEQNLAKGLFPPIWADTANFGYGYPLLHFYAPLAYYLILLFKQFTSSYLIGLELTMTLGAVVAGLGMYQLARKWGRGVGLLSAAAFLLSPYLAVNLYVRGALAELWSIALLPWLFLVWRDLSPKFSSILRTALTSSLFLLSHNLIPLITTPFLLAWVGLYQRHRPKAVLLAGLLTLGLSAFYLGPLLLERGFTQVEQIAKTTNYRLHFVEPWQLINSTWGFGGSAPGVEDGMSFKLGKFHLLLAALSFLLYFLRPKLKKTVIFFLFAFFFAALMATPLSRPLWDALPYLQLVQFPWRFLSLMIFFLAIAIGFSLSLFTNKILKILFLLFSLSFLLFYNLKYFRPQTKLAISDATYLEGSYITESLATIIPEYLPAWMPTFPVTPAADLPPTLEGPATVILPRAYYPTWRVLLDGQPVPFSPSPDGLITLEVPPGSHILSLTQSHTPPESISLTITLISLVLALYYYYRTRHDQA